MESATTAEEAAASATTGTSTGTLRVRLWVMLLALLATPVCYAAGFPPARLAWVSWVGIVPWGVAVRLIGVRAGLALTLWVTFLGSYLCTPWLSLAVANYYDQPLALGIALFAGVYLVTVGPFIAAFTLCFQALARRPSAWLPLLAGAAWTAAELGRARLFVGDPFGLFGYTQIELLPLVQVADVTGVYGISALVFAFNVALSELVLALPGTRRLVTRDGGTASPVLPSVRQALGGLGVSLSALGVVLSYGAWRLATYPSDDCGPATRIAVVQGNLDLGSQWRQEFYGRNLAEYMRLTHEVIVRDRPQLVFWPESAMTFFLEDEPLYRRALGSILLPAQTQLLAGGPRAVGEEPQRFYNSGLLVSPSGEVLDRYDKQRLLPFAEYFPFGGSDLLRRNFARVREFTPGGPARPLPTVAGRAGVVICNEAMFGELAGERIGDGADYLVTLTHDSWLGDDMYTEQAFDMARLRAVEQRRYLVRASTSGASAIIDPAGRVLQLAGLNRAEFLSGEIRTCRESTPYARVGDLFGVLCAAVCVGALLRRIGAASQRRGGLKPAATG